MGLFRKKETYNEQMLREAGLDRVVLNTPEQQPEPTPEAPRQYVADDIQLGPIAGSVKSGPMAWDSVTTATVPGIAGDHVEFWALPDGDLVVGERGGDGDFAPFADAVEEHLSPPYHAIAARQDGDLWGVGAAQIHVERFEFSDANALELTQNDGVTGFNVDGEPSDAIAPMTLQQLGARTGGDFCVEASRIDADYWDVQVGRL